MATYVILGSFTDQGIRNVNDSTKRLAAFKAAAATKVVAVKDAYYTIGSHDMVVVVEGPDDAVATSLLKLGSLDNIRTTSMRAYSPAEFKALSKKIG